MARIDGNKREHHRNRRSDKRRKRRSSKTSNLAGQRASVTRLLTRREQARPEQARLEQARAEQARLEQARLEQPQPEQTSTPPRAAALELDDEFFAQSTVVPLDPVEPGVVGEDSQPPVPTLTPPQLARRVWFRRKVKHLMAGLTAFTGFAALVHLANLG